MRRRLAIVAFVVIVATSLELPLLRLVLFHYPELTQRRADRRPFYPEFMRFLGEVRARTGPGDTIAIVVPTFRWDGGYAYAYYRASYLLPGREVLPIMTPLDRSVPDNVARAKYVAWWGMEPRGTRPVVWHGHGGTLQGR